MIPRPKAAHCLQIPNTSEIIFLPVPLLYQFSLSKRHCLAPEHIATKVCIVANGRFCLFRSEFPDGKIFHFLNCIVTCCFAMPPLFQVCASSSCPVPVHLTFLDDRYSTTSRYGPSYRSDSTTPALQER